MKRKSVIILLTFVLVMLTAAFAACKPSDPTGSKTYTMSFVTNGGGEIDSIVAPEGEDISDKLPADPQKSGYIFDGWFDNKNLDGNSATLPTKMPGKDTTYYAKWKEAPKVVLTLDADEGTLDVSTFEIPAGAKISEYIKDIKPEAEGLTFANWFYVSGAELGADDVMPSEPLTLVARYKAKVILNIYKMDIDGQYGEPEVKESMEWYKAVLDLDDLIDIEHFRFTEGEPHTHTVEKGDNILDIHLERMSYKISFNINAPADCVNYDGEVADIEALYGQTVKLPDNLFEAFMYRFFAWGTEANGGTMYSEGDDFTVEGNTTLYAIWDKGYIDRFGGIDILYVLSNENKVILVRPIIGEIEGTLDGDIFTITYGEDTLKGRISPDGKFVFFREIQEGVYNLLDPYENVVTEEKIELDGYDSAEYTDAEGNVYNGTYVAEYDPDTGEFLGTYSFVNEDNMGFYFMMQEILLDENDEITQDAEAAVRTEVVFLRQSTLYGVFYRFVLAGIAGEESLIYPTFMIFDGFGSVVVGGVDEHGDLDISAMGTYKELADSSIVEARLTLDGKVYDTYRYKFLEINGLSVYIEYNEDLDGTFTNGSDTLTLDGFGDSENSAIYTTADGVKQGMYVCEVFSGSGNKIIRLTTETETLSIKLDGENFTVVGNEKYGEYYNYTEEGRATLPYIILDGEDEISLYIPDAGGRLVLAAEGTYTVDKEVYTASMTLAGEEFADYTQYLDMSFCLRRQTFYSGTDVTYLDIYTILTTEKTYNGANGSTLVIDDYGFGTYSDGVDTYSGVYFLSEREEMEGILEFGAFDENGELYARFYFKLDEAASAFTLLGDEIGSYVIAVGGNTANTDEVLFLDGDEGAILYAITEDGLQKKAEGTYFMDNDEFGSFVSDGNEFNFVIYYLGDEAVYSKFDKELNGVFTNGNDHLDLDGYEYTASYTPEGEPATNGNYYIDRTDDNLLVVYIVSDYEGNVTDVKYFELGEGKTFVERSYEWGEYAGWSMSGLTYEILKLDGHGNAKLYIADATAETETLIAQGTYLLVDESTAECKFTLKNESDEEENNFVAILATYDSQPVFIKKDANSGLYVNSLNILDLDGYGNAAYLDIYGTFHYGTYILYGRSIIDFQCDTLEEMFIRLNTENQSFEVITDGFVYEDNTLYKYLGNDDNVVIPDEITVIGAMAFTTLYNGRYTGNTLKTIDLKNVTTINDNAFRCCYDLTTIIGGEKVTKLGYGAFQSCIELSSLGNMTEVIEIGQMAFYGCDSITSVQFNKATIIGGSAFAYMYGLTRAEFTSAEIVETYVFYDCPELSEVIFGSEIKEIQDTAFEAAGEAVHLTVVLNTTDIVTIGIAVFAYRNEYIVKVPDLDTVLKFATDDGWKDYKSHLTHRAEYDGTFYTTSMERVVLYGVFYMYGSPVGVYDIEEADGTKKVTVYQISEGAFEPYYVGTITEENGLVFTEPYQMKYSLQEGKEYEFVEYDYDVYDYTDRKIIFTMKSGVAWSTEAKYDERDVMIEYEGDTYSGALYMIDGGYRRRVYPTLGDPNYFYFGDPEFIEINERYINETDGSWIYIVQKNAEKTDYALLGGQFAGITDANGNILFVSQERNIEIRSVQNGKQFTFTEPFDNYNYLVTITFNEEEKTFTYDYVVLTEITLSYENKTLVLLFNTDGSIYGLKFSIDDTEMRFVTYTGGDGNYVVTILDRGYEAEYNVTIDKLMMHCTMTQNGIAGRAWVNGVARVTVILKDNVPEFHTFVYVDGRETEVTAQVEKTDDVYEITTDGLILYVTYEVSGEKLSVTLSIAQITYRLGSDTFTVSQDKAGEITGVVLNLASLGKNLTEYEMYSDSYREYYRFTDGDKVYSVLTDNSNMSFELTVYTKTTLTVDNISLTYLATDDGRFDSIVSFSDGGVVKTVTSSLILYDVLIRYGNDYYFLRTGANPKLEKTEQKTAETTDGMYRFTVVVCGDEVVTVIKLEINEGQGFVTKGITEVYPNDIGEIIIKASGLSDRLHCVFTVTDGVVSAVVNPA